MSEYLSDYERFGEVVDGRTVYRDEAAPARAWVELRESGLLWLVNRAVFHPRGFALALVMRDSEPVGWQLLGDGSEPWRFGVDEDELFAAAEATLARPAAAQRRERSELPK